MGGRTALELQGCSHYLARETKEVHLYGPKPPPAWLDSLATEVCFVYHNSEKLFLSTSAAPVDGPDSVSDDSIAQPWGQWGWHLTLSSPERAVLELLDALPDHESFHQVDKLIEGLGNLSPRRLEKLLVNCRNVKVKRLFFYFADRHKHAWLKRINKNAVDFGKGKRMLVRGGKFDAAYQITVPENLDAVQ